MDAKETEQNHKNANTPIVCTEETGRTLVQLDGSHTTSTTTENLAISVDKKNVKFEDEKQNPGVKTKRDVMREADSCLSGMKLRGALTTAGEIFT